MEVKRLGFYLCVTSNWKKLTLSKHKRCFSRHNAKVWIIQLDWASVFICIPISRGFSKYYAEVATLRSNKTLSLNEYSPSYMSPASLLRKPRFFPFSPSQTTQTSCELPRVDGQVQVKTRNRNLPTVPSCWLVPCHCPNDCMTSNCIKSFTKNDPICSSSNQNLISSSL